jgi:arabinogalactan oligomer/maltooligosaccharide transport system substrate-binding protein
MYISGPWDVQGLKDANVPFAVAPLPKLEGGEVARPFMGVQAAFVASASKHKAEAWDLMKYLLDKTPMPLVDVGHRIPVRKADLADAKVANDPVMKAFAASAANANPMPNVPEVQAMWTPGANALKQITQQNVAADKAAADCKTEIEKQIAAMGQ